VIVVAGEALVDLLARPDGSLTAVPGGGPYNAARAIGRLGESVAWLGGLSSDRFGRTLEAALLADGVSLELVQRTDLPTTLALAELDAGGVATYRFYAAGTAAPAVERPAGGGSGLPASMRAFHVGTLGLVLEPMATTIEALIADLPAETLLFVDPNCRPTIVPDADAYRARVVRVLGRADLVKVSAEDLAFLRPDEDLDAGGHWLASLGARAVLVTDGPRPVRVLVDGDVATIAVPRVPVVDTVGAGDVFGAAVLAALVHGRRTRSGLDRGAIVDAVAFGVRASAITCERAGADPPTIVDIGGWPPA
jgi:fructokinase